MHKDTLTYDQVRSLSTANAPGLKLPAVPPQASTPEDSLLFLTQSAQLERVANAAEPLEATEQEYSLDKLVSHCGLDKSAVLNVLKNFWIEADELDIVFLNLNPTEEHLLYGDR